MVCKCNNVINTTSVAVSGTNLVLTVPTTTFENCERYVIRVAQAIPATATNLMPVVVQIGTDTTLYPIVRKCGHYLYANQIRTNRNYAVVTAADTQRFVLVCGYICGCNAGSATTIPAATAAATE